MVAWLIWYSFLRATSILKNNKVEAMMNHQIGDLLWIPQAAMLYRGPNNPMAVRFNDKPKIGLFVEKAEYEGFIVIEIEGETWIMEEKHIRKLKGEVRNAS